MTSRGNEPEAFETREASQLLSSQIPLISKSGALADTPAFCRNQEYDGNICQSFPALPRAGTHNLSPQRERQPLPTATLPYHIFTLSSLLDLTANSGPVCPSTHLCIMSKADTALGAAEKNPEENAAEIQWKNQSSHSTYWYHSTPQSP